MSRPLILITNDDGVTSPYLEALESALSEIGDTRVYAPDRNQSGVGHGISLHRPLRVTHLRENWYSVDGTPTDCVMLAVKDLLDHPPAVVVSGINDGPNLGDDVTYSGTVAGAYEGMLLGFPSVAISSLSREPQHLETVTRFAQFLVGKVLDEGLPDDTVLNVNVPDLPWDELQGVAITRQGRRDYEDVIIQREDPRGVSYYWIGGDQPNHEIAPGTDFEAISQGRISVTPLHRDLTNFQSLESLSARSWELGT